MDAIECDRDDELSYIVLTLPWRLLICLFHCIRHHCGDAVEGFRNRASLARSWQRMINCRC